MLQYSDDFVHWIGRPPYALDVTPPYGVDLAHPVKVCAATRKVKLLTHLLRCGADPDMGLLKEWDVFCQMPKERQLNNRLLYRFGQSPLNTVLVKQYKMNECLIDDPNGVKKYRDNIERAKRLCIINCLLFYGASPNIAGVYYTPLHALVENYGSTNEDVIVSAKLMVLCGLKFDSEQWLLDRLHPGVPLGSPELRRWLLENVRSPMPLLHRCIVVIRQLLAPRTFLKASALPVPKQISSYILLEHIFCPPLEDGLS